MDEQQKLANAIDYVRVVLQNHPETRSDDDLLFLEVIKLLGYDPDEITLEDFLKNRYKTTVPCFETVRRGRQEIQHDDESLRPPMNVREARALKRVEYEDFFAKKKSERERKKWQTLSGLN